MWPLCANKVRKHIRIWTAQWFSTGYIFFHFVFATDRFFSYFNQACSLGEAWPFIIFSAFWDKNSTRMLNNHGRHQFFFIKQAGKLRVFVKERKNEQEKRTFYIWRTPLSTGYNPHKLRRSTWLAAGLAPSPPPRRLPPLLCRWAGLNVRPLVVEEASVPVFPHWPHH